MSDVTNSAPRESRGLLFFSQALAGLGLGLLLGVIMGMTVSPTVQVMLGALSSVMTAFLGFDKELESEAPGEELLRYRREQAIMSGIRAGSFGLAVFGGLMLGVNIRAKQSFSLTPAERVERWESAGFTLEEAKSLVKFETLGLDPKTGELIMVAAPEGGEEGEEGEGGGGTVAYVPDVAKANSSNLFGADAGKNYADSFDPDRFASASDVLKAMKDEEEPAFDPLIAAVEKSVPEAKQMTFLKLVHKVVVKIENDQAPANLCDHIDPAARDDNMMAVLMGSYRAETDDKDLQEISLFIEDAVMGAGKPDKEVLGLLKALHTYYCKHVELQALRNKNP